MSKTTSWRLVPSVDIYPAISFQVLRFKRFNNRILEMIYRWGYFEKCSTSKNSPLVIWMSFWMVNYFPSYWNEPKFLLRQQCKFTIVLNDSYPFAQSIFPTLSSFPRFHYSSFFSSILENTAPGKWGVQNQCYKKANKKHKQQRVGIIFIWKKRPTIFFSSNSWPTSSQKEPQHQSLGRDKANHDNMMMTFFS